MMTSPGALGLKGLCVMPFSCLRKRHTPKGIVGELHAFTSSVLGRTEWGASRSGRFTAPYTDWFVE